MDAGRWAEAKRLFEAAVELDPAARDAWLAAACPDPALRAEVDALLEADARAAERTSVSARADHLLDALGATAPPAVDETGRRYGAWELLHPLGEGGMGTVWLAQRREGGFTQRAALKRVRSGWNATTLVDRFRHERQILAGLEHPNIARLIDGGVGPEGDPFLALEYVEGVDLRQWCESRELGLAARLRLFLTVCAAVSHAHSRLVVHRDLKPSNILVTEDGTVKLLDFGVAKLLDADVQAEQTAMHLRLFTPEYAAPEQVRGDPTTTSVDVYALGVVLYELLVGQRPLGTGRRAQALEHAVLTEEPLAPSQALTRTTTGAATRATRRELRARLRGDLDAIVLKALRKSPEERYASVRALADDVLAWLEHRPVAARRGTRRYRVGRFLRRHALAVGLTAFAFLALLAGLGAASWQAAEARRQRDAAAAENEKAEQALAFMQGIFLLADPEAAAGRDVTARALLEKGLVQIRSELHDQPAVRSRLLRAMGEAQLGIGLRSEAAPAIEESLALARELDDPLQLRDAARVQARLLDLLGREREAVELLAPMRASFEPRTVAEQRQAAELDEGLAYAYYSLGEYDSAERHHRAALALFEREFGLAHARSQSVVTGLVGLLLDRDRSDEALQLAERALAALPPASDDPDPLRASALANLALVRADRNELDEAERLRREVLELQRRIVGEEHLTFLGAESNLATVLFARGRAADAMPRFEHVLAGYRAQLGPDHPRVAFAAANSAYNALRIGQPGRALGFAREAHRIREATLGPRHHSVGFARMAIGTALLDLGRLVEARIEIDAGAALYHDFYPAGSPSLLLPLGLRARAELEAGGKDCSAAAEARRIVERTAAMRAERRAYLLGLDAACRLRQGEADAVAAFDAARAALVSLGPVARYELDVLDRVRTRSTR